MVPLIVLTSLSSRLYYLQHNIHLTLAQNENTRATNGDNIAHLCMYLQNVA